jgi:peptide/nickel transport system permease protein
MTAPVLAPVLGPDGESPPREARTVEPASSRVRFSGSTRPWALYLAVGVVLMVVLWALVPGLFAPGSAVDAVPRDKLLPPSAVHWFGTDTLGRDLFGRVVHGAVHSLSGALIAVTVGLALGTLIGAIAGAIGGTFFSVLRRHVLPNSLTPIAALAALQFGTAILAISTLGFLGYGAPPPTPEWGLLIAEGRNYVATAWWLTALPGLVVVAVVLSANRISQGLGRNVR